MVHDCCVGQLGILNIFITEESPVGWHWLYRKQEMIPCSSISSTHVLTFSWFTLHLLSQDSGFWVGADTPELMRSSDKLQITVHFFKGTDPNVRVNGALL